MPVNLKDYRFAYALSEKNAIDGVNLSIEDGEILILCGASGSGKSTLLRSLKQCVAPVGTHTGTITGLPDDSDIAIVFQNPDMQLVTTTVINDLVFQMENRGVDPLVMKRRMSETVGFFGLEALLHTPVSALSGGQKQLTALCAALMCEPTLLLLDEPVSQLDPLSAAAFLEAVRKVNSELGVTVVMTEHRLEECAAMADRIAFMAHGRVLQAGPTAEVLSFLYAQKKAVYVPQLARVSLAVDGGVTLSPRAFRMGYPSIGSASVGSSTGSQKFQQKSPQESPKKSMQISSQKSPQERMQQHILSSPPRLLHISDAVVTYDRTSHIDPVRPVLRRVNLSCNKGEILCVLGGNGSGKTTLLKLAAGIVKPFLGKVRVKTKRLGYMPQQVRDLFIRDRVSDELTDLTADSTQLLIERLNLRSLLTGHPFDLSGGEQQKLALASILSRRPELILLDEPTKGMDPAAKRMLATLLGESGAAVLIATHDMEFAAEWAHRCAMLFDGEIAYDADPTSFFSRHVYYTTAIHKGLRHIDENAVTLRDAYALWGLETVGDADEVDSDEAINEPDRFNSILSDKVNSTLSDKENSTLNNEGFRASDKMKTPGKSTPV